MNSKDKNFFNKKNSNKKDKFTSQWGILSVLISGLIITSIIFVNSALGEGVMAFTHSLMEKMGFADKIPSIPFIGGRQNILLLGVDSNGKESDPFTGTRSDTILVMNIDPYSKTVNILSIPRDSKVYISNGHGVDKINSAHALGGPELTKQTIEETFGIKIDHYMVINYEGVKELVDALGGVTINVEKRMNYDDFAGGLHVHLRPGEQVLDSKKAEQYLRFRHDAISDIGRMRRQQWFMKGVAQKFQSPDIIPKIPSIIQLADKYIKTDMNIYDLSKYAAYLKSVNLEDAQIATLPGGPSSNGRISYWILDSEKTQKVIDKLIYRSDSYQKPGQVDVALMYSSKLQDSLSEFKTELTNLGFNVVCTSRTRDPHSQILIHSTDLPSAVPSLIKKNFSVLKDAQYVIETQNYPCTEADLSIILAGQ